MKSMLIILLVSSLGRNIISVISSDRSIDVLINVEDGDQFTYFLMSNKRPDDYWGLPQSQPLVLEQDFENNKNISISEGEQFTITVVNATPQLDETGNYSIILNLDNGTSNDNFNEKISTLSFVTFTDWVFWENEIRNTFAINATDFEDEGNLDFKTNASIDIKHTNEYFKWKLEVQSAGNISDYEYGIARIIFECHYNTKTGVLLYFAFVFDVIGYQFDPESAERIPFFETIFNQVGYDDFELPSIPSIDWTPEKSSDDIRTGYSSYLISIIAITILYRKKSSLEVR